MQEYIFPHQQVILQIIMQILQIQKCLKLDYKVQQQEMVVLIQQNVQMMQIHFQFINSNFMEDMILLLKNFMKKFQLFKMNVMENMMVFVKNQQIKQIKKLIMDLMKFFIILIIYMDIVLCRLQKEVREVKRQEDYIKLQEMILMFHHVQMLQDYIIT